jgi:hypothetical protein
VQALANIDDEIQRLGDEASNATGPELTILMHRIKVLQEQQILQQKLLDECIKNPPPPPPPDFMSNLTAVVTIRTDNGRASGPFTTNFARAIGFSADRTRVLLFGLFFDVGQGITIQQAGGGNGTFDAATGAMSIPISFQLHIPQIPFDDPNAKADFPSPGLTTEAEVNVGPFSGQGTRLNRNTGQLVLVGTSTVSDNLFVNGTHVEVRLTGVVNPVP